MGGDITVVGNASDVAAGGGGYGNDGIRLEQGQIITASTGNVSLTGRGSVGSRGTGVSMVNSSAVEVADGSLSITGVGGGDSASTDSVYNRGVLVYNGSQVKSSATGSVTVHGTGGVGGPGGNVEVGVEGVAGIGPNTAIGGSIGVAVPTSGSGSAVIGDIYLSHFFSPATKIRGDLVFASMSGGSSGVGGQVMLAHQLHGGPFVVFGRGGVFNPSGSGSTSYIQGGLQVMFVGIFQ